MFHHPDQLMTLNTSHLRELKAENDQWHLATKVMQAQRPVRNYHPNLLGAFYARVCQLLHKLTRPAWKTIVKPT